MAKQRELEEKIRPIAEPLGYEVVEVEFRTGRETVLTVCIDKPGGVTLEDCERVHNLLDPLLDEWDPTDGRPYTFNVSSPGLDRAIKTDRDFERNLSKEVDVKLFAPLEGKKLFTGSLTGYDETSFTVETADGPRTFERAKAAKVSLHLDF